MNFKKSQRPQGVAGFLFFLLGIIPAYLVVVHFNTKGTTMKLLDSNCGLPAVLSTDEAAAAINRCPQTLRKWACLETGPIKPIRINGRLAWKVAELATLLGGGAKNE